MPGMEKVVEYEDLESHLEAKRDKRSERSPKFQSVEDLEKYRKSKPNKGREERSWPEKKT
ncbi:MAG: hypothetical protein M8353_03255 [ANME-2 cluster archaeon]|nr:hypothetical protein [ANME-2 cluster archaeon]